MSSSKCYFTYALRTLVIGATLVFIAPVGAEDSTTIDLSTQPHLKSWSNVVPNAAKRFVVLADFNNAAVLDRETGLVWEKTPSTAMVTWNQARRVCPNKAVGGRKGWRLPSVPELASLIDPSNEFQGPTLPAGHPFTSVLPDLYWSVTSSTTKVEVPTSGWFVVFRDGYVESDINPLSPGGVWCVRGGMIADAY